MRFVFLIALIVSTTLSHARILSALDSAARNQDTVPVSETKALETADSMMTRELDEFVVSANNSYVKLKGTNLSVDVSHSPLGDLPSTDDLLSQLPFVKGSDGSFSVVGRGHAVVYIGNRKMQDSSELTRIQPSDIKSVEIIRNPGAEYDAGYVAVIKIILKRRIVDGLGVRAYTKETMGRRLTDYQLLSLTYGGGPTDFFLTADNDSYRVRGDQTNLQTFYTSANLWEMTTAMPGWNADYYQWTVTGGGNLNLPSGHSAGAKVTYTNDTQRNSGDGHTEMTRDGEGYETLLTHSSQPQHYHQWQVNAYYEGEFSERCSLSFNGDYVSRRAWATSMTEEEGSFTPYHEVDNSTSSRYDLWTGTLKLHWNASGRSVFNFGLDGSLINQDRVSVQNQPAELSLLDSREGKYALFCQYALSLGRWQMDAGLRYETMTLDYRDGADNSRILDRTYRRLYPAFTFSSTFGAVNMALGLTSRISRPTFYQLRSGSEYFNRYITVRGNPLLLPTYTYELSYSLQYRDLVVNAGFEWVRNPIGEESVTDSTDPLHQVHYPVNLRSYREFSVGVNYSREAGLWRGNVSANMTKTFYDVPRDFPDMPRIGSTPYMNFSMSNYLTFSGATAYVTINYNPAGAYCNTWVKPYTGISLGIYRRFLRRALYVSLKAGNILGAKSRSVTYQRNYVFDRTRYDDSRRVVLVVSYTFRHKNKYKRKDSAQDEIRRMQ